MKRPLKICFISFNSYPLFSTNHPGYFGGAELQISLLTKELAKDKNFRVSLVVDDYGQPMIVKKNNLAIYKCFRPRGLGTATSLFFLKTLKRINADIYVERTMNVKVGPVALFCRLFKKKFVYMLAHDWDSTWQFKNYLQGLTKWWYFFGLKKADLILAQTESQKQQLKTNFGLKSVMFRSLAMTPPAGTKTSRRFFLWVGRADQWKRPEVFIDLAARLPKERLVMICRQGDNKKYFARIKKLARRQTNLRFLESVSLGNIIHYFKEAKAYVNTSVAEGFPNTFLQAGITKTPIISLSVNPDGFLTKFHCGVCANNSFPRLIEACQNVKTYWGDNGFRYVTKFHSLRNARGFAQILLDHFSRPAA